MISKAIAFPVSVATFLWCGLFHGKHHKRIRRMEVGKHTVTTYKCDKCGHIHIVRMPPCP